MADPVTLGVAGVGLLSSAAGGAITASGQAQSGQAQAAVYNYQAGVAQVNKQIADQNAQYAVASGEVQAQMQGMQTRAEIGQTRAQQGAGGLDVNSGTNVNVRASEAEVGAMDAATIRANAARTAYGYEVEGMNQAAQAQVDTLAASQAITAGNTAATGTILGSVSSVSSKWLQGNTQGLWNFTSPTATS